MTSYISPFERPGFARTILVVCCLLLLALPKAALSTPSEKSSAAPGQPARAETVSEAAPLPLTDLISLQQPLLSTIEPPSPSANEEIKQALRKPAFSYSPNEMVDPFIPFIAPVELAPPTPPVTEDDTDLPPEPQKPLTPLQRMSVAEIDRGLRAISWGGLGRKAVIEDAAGKGYIVSVGTPAADNNGIITEIFNDRLVIQQETWDRKQKRMIPRNSTVKLRKEKEK